MCLSVWLRDINFPLLSWRGVASMALASPHCIRPCQHEEGAVSWELYQQRPVSPSPRGRECGGLVLFLPQHRWEAVMRGWACKTRTSSAPLQICSLGQPWQWACPPCLNRELRSLIQIRITFSCLPRWEIAASMNKTNTSEKVAFFIMEISSLLSTVAEGRTRRNRKNQLRQNVTGLT